MLNESTTDAAAIIAFSADGKLSQIRYFVAHRSVEYGHFNSVDTDADCTIQWLIALMVMCCDPLLSH
jgi:hypothetical protein